MALTTFIPTHIKKIAFTLFKMIYTVCFIVTSSI